MEQINREWIIVEDTGESHLYYHSNHHGLPSFTNSKQNAYRFSSKALAEAVLSEIRNPEDFVVEKYDNVKDYHAEES